MESSRLGRVNIGLLALASTVGWLALPLLLGFENQAFRPFVLGWPWWSCLALAAISRLLAVRIYQRARLALDSAFYISAVFMFGTLAGALLALSTLTFDGIVRVLRGSAQISPHSSLWRRAAFVASLGGLPASLIVVIGYAMNVDGQWPHSDQYLTWALPIFSLCFLAVHYLLAGGTHWQLSSQSRSQWWRLFLRVLVAELSLVPLALAMVLGSSHQGMGLFFLLGTTCLLFNVIFRRATVTADSLQDRVQELSILNKVGRILSGSLERQRLLANIARETLSLVRHTSRFMIGTVAPDSDEMTYELFDEEGNNYRRMHAPRDDGLSGWVMAHRKPLLLGDIQRQYRFYSKTENYNDPHFHSWLGVPLIIYDEVMGVMSVQSEQRHAYSPEQLRVLMTIADQAAVALENSRLYELATVDGLTGLLVRRHFEQRLREEWSRAQRYGSEFSFGIFDLDNFKQLNDTHGHQAGDLVLRAAAGVVRDNMRGPDIAGRYGGEEFVFLLPRTNLAEAVAVGERICAGVAALRPRVGEHVLQITASIGLAACPASGAKSTAELMAKADAALYDAKRLGKNRVCVAPSRSVAVAEG